jgi:dolichol-phosphate mannosyltransferase
MSTRTAEAAAAGDVYPLISSAINFSDHGSDLSIIVPTYREVENLPELAARVFRATESAGIDAEMLVVDDDSDDGTDRVCEQLAERLPVRLLVRRGERGLATAVLLGLHEARGEVLLVMDADLSHPPEKIGELYRSVSAGGFDVALGSRFVAGGAIEESWGWQRRLNSKAAKWLAFGLTRVHDPMAGFFAMRREVFETAPPLRPLGYKILLEILAKCPAARVEELAIDFQDRHSGESKLNLEQRLLYLRHLWRLYELRFPPLRRDPGKSERGTACPSCDGRESRVPFPDEHPWLVRCRRCRLMRAQPQPSAEELEAIYGEHYFDEWGATFDQASLEAMKRKTFRRLVAPLATKHVRASLDVGCGLGYTMDQAREQGWDAYGLDVSTTAVRSTLARHPDRVVCGSAEDLDQANLPRPFDLVTMFDVLEHLRDPIEVLRKVRHVLAADGMLLVSTIEASGLVPRVLGAGWFHIHRAHLWYFTRDALARMFDRAGLEVVEIRTATKHFTGRYVAGIVAVKSSNRLLRSLARLCLRWTPRAALNLALPALREGVLVIARPKHRAPPAATVENGAVAERARR